MNKNHQDKPNGITGNHYQKGTMEEIKEFAPMEEQCIICFDFLNTEPTTVVCENQHEIHHGCFSKISGNKYCPYRCGSDLLRTIEDIRLEVQLKKAIATRNVRLFEELLVANPHLRTNCDIKTEALQMPLLSLLISKNCEEMAAIFIQYGSNLDQPTLDRQQTALHLAAIRRMPRIAGLLLAHGADINMEDSMGYTALHYSVGADDATTVGVLLQANPAYKVLRNHLITTPRAAPVPIKSREVLNLLLEHREQLSASNYGQNYCCIC